MHESKLFEVIKAFDSTELERLHAFLQSPFFYPSRSNEVQLRLFELILADAPAFNSLELTKEKAFAHLFPKRQYHKGQLEKSMSQLLKEIFRFIGISKSLEHDNEVRNTLAQAEFFREKQMDKFFNKSVGQLRKEQSKRQRKGKEYYYEQYLIEQKKSEYKSFYNTRDEELNITNTLQSLDIFYLLSKLEYTCLLLSQNLHVVSKNVQESINQLEEILPKVNPQIMEDIPLIKIYACAFFLLQGKREESSFQDMKRLLDQQEDQIPLDQLKALLTFLRNYCVIKYNSGEVKYLAEAFQLYQMQLKKGYLYYQGKLMPSTIRSVVSLGLRLKEYDWVYAFLESSRNKIAGTKHPDDVFHLNLASYYFALREYDQALELLSDKYEDIYYRIGAKRMEVMIFFEQDSPITNARLDAFKIYIFRLSKKSVSDLQREGNNSFADILKQILNPKTQGNATRIGKLIQKVREKKVIADKAWLLETLEGMLK